MLAVDPPGREPGSASPAARRPWRSGLVVAALGLLVALAGLALSRAMGRWMGAEQAAPGVIGRAAGYPVGLLGFVVAAEGAHRTLWWGPSRVPRWLRIALSALATGALAWIAGAIALAVLG